MQAIKCVVVGDGYAIILLYLYCYNFNCLWVSNQEVLKQRVHDKFALGLRIQGYFTVNGFHMAQQS